MESFYFVLNKAMEAFQTEMNVLAVIFKTSKNKKEKRRKGIRSLGCFPWAIEPVCPYPSYPRNVKEKAPFRGQLLTHHQIQVNL